MKSNKRNRKGFRFYLVNARTGLIQSGHESKREADKAYESEGGAHSWFKIQPIILLSKLRIDPDKDESWVPTIDDGVRKKP